MEILKVADRKTNQLFHKVLHTVYRGDAHYIFPLEVDVDFVFNRNKNESFQSGDAVRFVLIDDSQRPIGRIAAFYSKHHIGQNGDRSGGVGFFECINDRQAAKMLFQSAEQWLNDQGVNTCQGPLNFGEGDKYWGLLVEGYTAPTYLENYHKPYYKELFEAAGYLKKTERASYIINRSKFKAKRFTKVAEWISRKPGFDFRHFEVAKVEQFADDFVEVYNKVMPTGQQFMPIDHGKFMSVYRAMRHVLVEEFIWFAYSNNKPIGVLVMIPDINSVLKPLRGKFDTWSRLRFHYLKNATQMDTVKGVVFGVDPKFRSYGIDTVLIYKFYKELTKTKQFQKVQLSVGENQHPKLLSMLNNTNAEFHKRHVLLKKIC